jgi:hypothetical protein
MIPKIIKFLIIYSKILLNRKVYKVYLIIMTLSVQFSIHQTIPHKPTYII